MQNFTDNLFLQVEKDTFKLMNIEVEKTAFMDGTQKYGFQFMSWLCTFIKNKHQAQNLPDSPFAISDFDTLLLENKIPTTKTKFGNFLKRFFKREIYGKNGFIFAKFKEPVVKNVPYDNEMINIYIESRIIAILGYALVLRPKYLIYKAMDLYALPATRKNNPNKTNIDFT